MIIREEKLNTFLDYMQIILSLLSIVILTIFFRMYSTSIRYLFLLVDFCLVITLSRLLAKLDLKPKQDERVIKYSKSKIDSKFIKKVRF